jgi:hypothetical protein
MEKLIKAAQLKKALLALRKWLREFVILNTKRENGKRTSALRLSSLRLQGCRLVLYFV